MQTPPAITDVVVNDELLGFHLEDGRFISVPVAFYPTLALATPEERTKFEISGSSVYWPELDADIGVEGLLAGAREHHYYARKAVERAVRLKRLLKTQKMKTYLLTWNPKRYPWDNLPKEANETAAGKTVTGRRSCGIARYILIGARIFLIRLGTEPKGIIASGWVNRTPYLDKHWDEEKARKGEQCFFVGCEWEQILDPMLDPPLSLAVLQKKLGNVHWTPQAGGIQIPEEATMELENLWAVHLSERSFGMFDDEIGAFEGEKRLRFVCHRRREQKLRASKLSQFREKNGRLYCEVPGCGFDFEKVYGSLGKGFAHVHHLKPLGDRESPSQTLLDDLVIVCANCHAMIHRDGKCRGLDELIS